MKPSAKLVSGFLLISLVVSVLSGCSLLPGASSPVAQSTPGTVTPHLDEKDRVEAAAWFRKASAQGSVRAEQYLEQMSEKKATASDRQR